MNPKNQKITADAVARFKTLVSELLRGWWSHLRRHYRVYGGVPASLMLAAVFTIPRDAAWVDLISADQHRLLGWSTALSHWGDFRGTLLVALTLAVAAFFFHRRVLARVAMAVVLAAVLAGAVANVGRVTIGRPRPVSAKPDGVYGPTLEYKLHSFPSAHSATAAATSSALFALHPSLGVVASVATLSVMWSRIHLRQHHPTDVAFGALIGVTFGLGLGLSAVRGVGQRPDSNSKKTEDPSVA